MPERAPVRALLVVVAASLLASGCGAEPPHVAATTSTPSTVLSTTVAADVALPKATDLVLDLPGVEAEVELTTCTLRVTVQADTLRFPVDSAALPADPAERRVLDEILDRFAQASTVTVTGHASTEGRPQRNQVLSQQRAEAVAAAGRARLPHVEFRALGVGSTSTTVPEDGTEATRAANRRVELVGRVRAVECTDLGAP